MTPHSRGAFRPGLACLFRPTKGVGNAGRHCTRSLACKIKKAHEHSHYRSSRTTRRSRTRWCYGFLRALPGEPRSFATVAGGYYRRLDTGVRVSGPRAFSVRKTALSSAALLTSTASLPYVRDDRETPLVSGPG